MNFHCYLIGEAGLGKTTLFNFLTNSENNVSHEEIDGKFECDTKVCHNFQNKIIEITDTPGINDSKDLTSWWSLIHSKIETNLIVFFINGTSIRDSSNRNLKEIIQFCINMNYDFIFLYIHKIPFSKHIINIENLKFYQLINEEEAKNELFNYGSTLTKQDFRNFLEQYEFKKKITFLSPLFVIKMYSRIRTKVEQTKEDFINIERIIDICYKEIEEETKKLLETLRFTAELELEYNEKIKILKQLKRDSSNSFEEMNKKLKEVCIKIENVKSKFISKNGDKMEKRKTGVGHHLYSWLPIAGSFNLAYVRDLEEYCYLQLSTIDRVEIELNDTKLKFENLDLKENKDLEGKILIHNKGEGELKRMIDSTKSNIKNMKEKKDCFKKDIEELINIYETIKEVG